MFFSVVSVSFQCHKNFQCDFQCHNFIVTKGERIAINNLRKDDNIMILPADKARSTVVMNKSDNFTSRRVIIYLMTLRLTKSSKQIQLALASTKSSLFLFSPNWKNMLCLRTPPATLSIDEYWKLYPTSEHTPRYYGLSKIHKAAIPLRSIISSVGSITYDTANFCAKFISPPSRKNALPY